eukprot:SAG22_NODE_862_length_6808_cov_3.881204_6_plen_55_part_00
MMWSATDVRQVDEFLQDTLNDEVYFRFNPEGVNWSVQVSKALTVFPRAPTRSVV